ncbi:epi-isozizaene synthase [Fusarium phyllophilum]|uniref:Epi-isozizaene synthase n=1 Tax=Fusarium phyllophilum TaxID=47803 RepID=A0A8H5MS18_9HYPO|nr:epi-isozizaene synthase [Fusarium phyllophilum]
MKGELRVILQEKTFEIEPRGLKPEFLHHHTVILNGATNAEDYGKLIHWDDHPDAEEWDVAAEDHIWALREDPAYFSEQFREMLDHREEILPDINGNPHPVLEPYRINTLWSRILRNMVMHAYSNLQVFILLYNQAKELIELEQRVRKDIDPTKDLPLEFDEALIAFKFALDQAVEGPAGQLEHSHFAAPPIRNRFVRMPPPDPYTLEMNVIPRSEHKITGVEKQVMYLIQTMWQDSWGLFIARLPLTVDELERLLQSDRNADALISAHVARILGDFAIIGHCLKQLELYQPWAAQFDQIINSNFEVYQHAWGRVRGKYGQLNEAFLQGELDEAARLAEPSGGKFTYPYSKCRTKETVDTLRRAEANLDIVWAKIDQVTKKHVTKFDKTYVHHFLSQPRTLRRTAEWVEPEKTDSKVEPVANKDLWELNKPLSKLFLDEPAQEPKKFKPEVKSKTKLAKPIELGVLDRSCVHAVNETVRSRLTKANLSEQLAGWYPSASREKLEVLTSFQVWMFIIDDLLDQYSIVEQFDYNKLQALLNDCEDYVERSLGVSSQEIEPSTRYLDHDAVLSFEEYASTVRRLYSDNPSYRKRIAKEAIATLKAYQKEAFNRRNAHLPSLDEYLGYRDASSCMKQVAANIEFANGLNLPEYVMESKEIQELYEASVAVMWITNDIVSVRKEIREGFVENIVVLLAHGDMQRGIDASLDRLQVEIERVNKAADDAARRFAGEIFERDIALLGKNCKNMCLSSWFWSVKTPRYCLHDINPDADGGFNFMIDQITEGT